MSDSNKNDKKKKIQKRSSHFLPYKTTYDLSLHKRELNLINILMQVQGYEYGFFTVLGVRPLSQRGNHKNSAIYVVRCRCGKYAVRTLKAIKNPVNVVDMCEHCLHLYNLRRRSLFLTTGKYVELPELTGIKYKPPLDIKV